MKINRKTSIKYILSSIFLSPLISLTGSPKDPYLKEGIELLNTIQEVYLDKTITIA
jgi:hypothetical protein